MSDHVLYTKPLLVTEEKLREAREKQEKQRALREALDKQIEQTKKRKHNDVSKDKPTSLVGGPQEKRYTFSYENGHGKFVLRDDSTEHGGNPTTTRMLMNTRYIPPDPISTQRPSYQSNSLPPNFSMSTSDANPLVPKRPEYNTNSVPVDLVYNISKQKDLTNISPPQVRENVPRGITPRGSPASGGLTDDNEYQTNCLPRNFNLEEVKSQLQHQSQPQSQRHPRSPGRARVLPSGGTQSPFARSPRTPRRPGGPLPPLEIHEVGNGKRTPVRDFPENVGTVSPPREQLAVQPQNGGVSRPVKPKQPLALRGRSNDGRARGAPVPSVPRNNIPTRVVENKVEMLQKELESRDVEMAKLREKEKSWEEQVKQLKLELKSAKKKERDLNKLVKEGPRRAETAPDQPIVSPPVLSSPAIGGKKTNGGPSGGGGPMLGKKQDFAKSRIFTHKNFRPISAPSETVSIVDHPSAREPLPPLQDSFKCASVLTRKTAFGLPEEHANRPVPIEYEHLLQFVNEQIITQQQADGLWRLFTNGAPPLALLRRQSGAVCPVEEVVLNKSYRSEDIDITLHESDHCFINNEGKTEEEEEEDNKKGMEFDSNAEISSVHYETERDTFETFAELHLDDYLSQEGPDEEQIEERSSERNGSSEKSRRR
ncbi:uncharacterized protein TM35_000072240 [Trypanosoma theileri]|uniref:Uncharacterized protein n=1 Tax=Trypanosoma theileri TaxID=67003 RepID=A0A1X0P323_9TRYP|nr:uncharacterized protein TM35_000072240 [Trypanosoma theileri]ORC90800.1 hypothetical protein TM35_000072240 [Trypanosoma theileri]